MTNIEVKIEDETVWQSSSNATNVPASFMHMSPILIGILKKDDQGKEKAY